MVHNISKPCLSLKFLPWGNNAYLPLTTLCTLVAFLVFVHSHLPNVSTVYQGLINSFTSHVSLKFCFFKFFSENGDLHFPGFRQGSFLEHKSISFNNELNTIDVTFQTNATEGLILFAADHKERGDFIQLSVVGGKLEFRFDPGDSLVFIRSDQNVNTGETITATATYV